MFPKQSLAIGINNHDLSRLNLKPCINDARDISGALKSIGFRPMVGGDLTMRQCRNQLDAFIGSIVPGSVAVFYFSGHGVQWQGRNYLIPSDAKGISVDNLSERTIDAQGVIEAMHSRRPRLAICILDCCRTDAPSEPLDALSLFSRKLPRDGPGLAAMRAPPATLIAFACAADETSSANSFNNRNSLYTAHLLRYITRRGVDIENILKRTASAVERESGQDQVPYRYSSCNETIYLADGIVRKQIQTTEPWTHRDTMYRHRSNRSSYPLLHNPRMMNPFGEKIINPRFINQRNLIHGHAYRHHRSNKMDSFNRRNEFFSFF